jgi:hypothetical protein
MLLTPVEIVMTKLSFLAVLCLLLSAVPSYPAPASGSLTGLVVDARDLPVSSAVVSWQAADGTRPHAVHTDRAGHFRLAPLRPGLYEFRAQANGKFSEWEHNVLVRSGAESAVTLHMVRTTAPGPSAGRKVLDHKQ